MQQSASNPWVGLVAVGFSPPDRLSAIARRIGWEGAVLSDPGRQLYSRLGFGRARWWRIYNPGTLTLYARALMKRERIFPPEEDTRQLGGDAVMVAGRVTTLWRPASPDGRPNPAEVIAAADAAVEAQR